ncbi:calcium-binding protein [Rhodobacter ferrooxidans]|uniref:Peptidase M10 serralysin C-terminal domain-containing protein n=1 Tax=Rhodobacter ferrooxidans TaxID=371731 RepID=C8S3G7_9RHOB|nr:calcium-binding protein [Rhodobacter sp. SW2]EEW24415.1 hypothetical protein Rsw2DRAFT_2595 [Rhodobacter sp. SW2]
MAAFQVVETFLDGPTHMLSGITDMELVQTESGLRLYSATRAGGGVLAVSIGADMALLDQAGTVWGSSLPAPARLEVVSLNGQSTLIVTGSNGARMGGYGLGADGSLGLSAQVIGSPSGTLAAQIMVEVGADTFCFVNRMGDAGLLGYRLLANGQMQQVSNVSVIGDFQGVDVTAMASFAVGAQSYLLVASTAQDALRSYAIGDDGRLTFQQSLGATQGLGLNSPSALEVVQVGGVTTVLLAAAGTSSISVVQIAADGGMNLTDHVIDTLDSRFQGVQALTSVVVEGRAFVFAGGGDDGLNMFTLLPDGRLQLMATQLQVPGMALHNISALSATVVGGVIELFVAGEGTGITRLRLDPGEVAATIGGTDGADLLLGSAANDMITGGTGNDSLKGDLGDDILLDGAGSDSLWGGAGADVFVLAADGVADVIRDFQVGIDRIDLSGWGRVYSVDELRVVARTGGATIIFGSETLTVMSANGQPIQPSAFQSRDLFNLWHEVPTGLIPGELPPESAELVGTSGDDTLSGTTAATLLDGLEGFDTVDFSQGQGNLGFDLLDSLTATMAVGTKVYRSIEAVTGGAGDDTIAGSQDSNRLDGGVGADQLFGRAGDDTLLGGDGDDVLSGGTGGRPAGGRRRARPGRISRGGDGGAGRSGRAGGQQRRGGGRCVSGRRGSGRQPVRRYAGGRCRIQPADRSGWRRHSVGARWCRHAAGRRRQ